MSALILIGCFYCEGPHFISTEYYTPLKDDVVNQYIYINNNLIFLGPRILNTQKIPRRLGMILKESVMGELRLRDQQAVLIKVDTIRVELEREDSATDKK